MAGCIFGAFAVQIEMEFYGARAPMMTARSITAGRRVWSDQPTGKPVASRMAAIAARLASPAGVG